MSASRPIPSAQNYLFRSVLISLIIIISFQFYKYFITHCLHILSYLIVNRPFYRYGGHIEFIRFKEYYRMPRGHEHVSFVFSGAFWDIFS